jgi:hypothetical protein
MEIAHYRSQFVHGLLDGNNKRPRIRCRLLRLADFPDLPHGLSRCVADELALLPQTVHFQFQVSYEGQQEVDIWGA